MRGWWVVLLIGSGCALTAQVRPTPAGALVAEASVGGPAALLGGAPVPLPLSAVGVSWGFGERSDLSAHAHLTTLLAQGIAGFDVGGSWLFLLEERWRPALNFGWRGYFFTDFKSGGLGFFEGAITASWTASRRWVPYVSLAVQLAAQGMAVDFAPAVGVQIRFSRFSLQAELRWFAPSRDVRQASVEWLSPYKNGAVGLVLGGRYLLLTDAR